MSIRLTIDRGRVIDLDDETITIGSDPSCTVVLTDADGLCPKHAVIRKLAGRWIVETRDAESIRVGDAEPTRMHWLNNGDVIRVFDGGPEIRFEPRVSLSNTSPPLSTPSLRTTAPATELPARPRLKTTASPRDDSSGTDADSELESDTLQLSKPKTLGQSHVLPPLENVSELEELKAPVAKRLPSRPRLQRRSRSSQFPRQGPTSNRRRHKHRWQPSPKFTSWLEGTQTSAAKTRLARARLRFWLQFAGGGTMALIAVAVWTIYGPKSGAVSTADSKTITTAEVPKSPDAPPKVSPTVDKPAEVSKPSRSIDPPAVANAGPAETPAKSHSATVIKPVEVPKVSAPKSQVASFAGVEAIYGVYAQQPKESGYFRIGTAWAATRRHLVTSGAVAMTVEVLQRDGLIIVVSQPALESPIRIKSARVHGAYQRAVERANVAKEQLAGAEGAAPVKPDEDTVPPNVELSRAWSDQSRFDLGIIEIAAGGRLKVLLNMDAAALPDVEGAEFTLAGFPFSTDDYRVDALPDDPPQERKSDRERSTSSEKHLSLTMEFPGDVAEANWSGSPVLNRNHRVIGVYSRAESASKGTKEARKHAIIWLGRLREFAPELE